MRSVPLPFLSKITLLWTRAREPGPVSPVKVDSPLPFPWTQRGEIYIQEDALPENAVALGLFASGVADFPIRPALQVGQLLQHLDNVPQLVQGALLQELPTSSRSLFSRHWTYSSSPKVRITGVPPCSRMMSGTLSAPACCRYALSYGPPRLLSEIF